MSWRVSLSRQAAKDAKNLTRSGLKPKAQKLLAVVEDNPFQNPPAYEKLSGNLAGLYSRQINRQHRLGFRAAHSSCPSDADALRVASFWQSVSGQQSLGKAEE